MLRKLSSLLRRPSGRPRAVDPLHALRARAEDAHARHRFAEAAEAWEAALRLTPDDAGVRIQCAHLWKEAGDYERAEPLYLAAETALPGDADLAMQLGHFYKTVGRLEDARERYRRALVLAPDWPEAAREYADLPRRDDAAALLVPALVPSPLPPATERGIAIRRFGLYEDGAWGSRRTLRGVQAIRGVCIDDREIVSLTLVIDGKRIASEALSGAVSVEGGAIKSVFNLWLDLSAVPRGLHYAQLQLHDADGGVRTFRDYVVIADPVDEDDAAESNALVSLDAGDARPVEEQIRTRDSVVRTAERSLFPAGVRTVLVLRLDQLGDLVASIPAIRRLRELLPGARLVGLLTAANAELARTLGLFDEQSVVAFPHDFALKRRVMPLADQEALRRRLAPYRFDIAIDLAQSDMSRPLLKLSGARFLHGYQAANAPWLDGRVGFDMPDRFGAGERMPHSAKALALVESLGAALRGQSPVIRLDDLPRTLLSRFGIAPDQPFIVLHGGARLAFSRWPHFAALATALLARTSLKLVMMLDDSAEVAALPAALRHAERVRIVTERPSFDEFDALLSYAALVIANDSGPKHLAALRGTTVITLFTARINWSEWGQETIGSIMSRRVPCAGCAIFHEPEECGKGFSCIRDIRVEEVLERALAALP